MASDFDSKTAIPDSVLTDCLNFAGRGGFHGPDPGIQFLICL